MEPTGVSGMFLAYLQCSDTDHGAAQHDSSCPCPVAQVGDDVRQQEQRQPDSSPLLGAICMSPGH